MKSIRKMLAVALSASILISWSSVQVLADSAPIDIEINAIDGDGEIGAAGYPGENLTLYTTDIPDDDDWDYEYVWSVSLDDSEWSPVGDDTEYQFMISSDTSNRYYRLEVTATEISDPTNIYYYISNILFVYEASPNILRVAGVGKNSASLSWNAPGYQYSVWMDTDAGAQLIISDITQTNYAVTGLEPETDYTMWVTYELCGLTFESTKVEFTTKDEDTIALELGTVTSGSISVSWNSAGVDRYNLYLWDGDSGDPVYTYSLTCTYTDFFDLSPDTTYIVGVDGVVGNQIIEGDRLVVTTASLEPVETADYRALLIGSSNTPDNPFVNLMDVNSMDDMLSSVYGEDGGTYTTVRLPDPDSQTVFEAISMVFADADENDVSLIYYSGHGDSSSSDRSAGAWALADSDGADDFVYLDDLADALERIPGFKIVFMDSCGSGAAVYPGEYTGTLMHDDIIVFTASEYQYVSYSLYGRFSVFTHTLIEGVGVGDNMPADSEYGNSDGNITVRELYDYICDNVDQYLVGGNVMNPQMYAVDSDYVLFTRTTPSPTPPPPPPGPGPDPSGGTSYVIPDLTGPELFVNRLYNLALGREGDSEGTVYWLNRLDSGSASGSDVVRGFLCSREFLNKDMSDEYFLDILYRVILGRQPDETGKTYWLNKLSSGVTRIQVIDGFLHSSEWNQICASYGIRSGNES